MTKKTKAPVDDVVQITPEILKDIAKNMIFFASAMEKGMLRADAGFVSMTEPAPGLIQAEIKLLFNELDEVAQTEEEAAPSSIILLNKGLVH